MVVRVTLHNMHQDRDETVRSFGAAYVVKREYANS